MRRLPTKTPPPSLFDGMDLTAFGAMVAKAQKLPPARPATGLHTMPLADVPLGSYGEVSAMWGPDGSREKRRTGWVTKPVHVFTGGIAGSGPKRKYQGQKILSVQVELTGSCILGGYAPLDATFTVLDPPAEHSRPRSYVGKGYRTPAQDVLPGQVFYIWNEGPYNERDSRNRYHVQAEPVLDGVGTCAIHVLVNGEGEAETRQFGAQTWVDVIDPDTVTWVDANLRQAPLVEVTSQGGQSAGTPPFDTSRLGAPRDFNHAVQLATAVILADRGDEAQRPQDVIAPAGGEDAVAGQWMVVDHAGMDPFVSLLRQVSQQAFQRHGWFAVNIPAGAGIQVKAHQVRPVASVRIVGAGQGDGFAAVRDVLSRSTYLDNELRLPKEPLERSTWEAVHALLTGMGASGGSRKGQPYRFGADRSADLRAFVAGGAAPKHERTTKGWVPTPAGLADDVVARFAHLALIPQRGRMLEPSAGDGALIRAVVKARPDLDVTAVEPVSERAVKLEDIEQAKHLVFDYTFEEYVKYHEQSWIKPYDLIVMNPPYALPKKPDAWIGHLRLAWSLLAKGGRLVAIVPHYPIERWDRQVTPLLREMGAGVVVEPLPAGSFKQSGTGVATCVIAVTKATLPHDASIYRLPQGEPHRVLERPVTTAGPAVHEPVQKYRGWGGERIVRMVGYCIVCGTSTWSHDDGDDDPRGALGLNASSALRAADHDAEGPDVCLCYGCADSGIMYSRGLDRAQAVWAATKADGQAAGQADVVGGGQDVPLDDVVPGMYVEVSGISLDGHPRKAMRGYARGTDVKWGGAKQGLRVVELSAVWPVPRMATINPIQVEPNAMVRVIDLPSGGVYPVQLENSGPGTRFRIAGVNGHQPMTLVGTGVAASRPNMMSVRTSEGVTFEINAFNSGPVVEILAAADGVVYPVSAEPEPDQTPALFTLESLGAAVNAALARTE